MTGARSLRVYLIAGEPSGDVLGARLMRALKTAPERDETAPDFLGVGGPEMIGEGLSTLFPMRDLTVMGLAEVLPRLPVILGRIRETAADIRAKRPDVVVTIDAPDFCFRVAKRLKGSGIPVVQYVAPSVWAWRPGRAGKVARLVDHVMCLLPFEPPYFQRAGVAATFVGHSILESGADAGDGARFRARHGIAPEEKVLAVLPGSRMSEITRLLPTFAETVRRLRAEVGALRVVVPTVATVADAVRAEAGRWPATLVVEGEAEKYDAFAAADAALAASGTVSLELAMAKVPSVIAYRLAPVTAAIARRLVRVRFASIVNILLDRAATPEFLNEACTADNLTPALRDLLLSEDARDRQMDEIERALRQFRPDGRVPSEAAAHVVRDVAARAR